MQVVSTSAHGFCLEQWLVIELSGIVLSGMFLGSNEAQAMPTLVFFWNLIHSDEHPSPSHNGNFLESTYTGSMVTLFLTTVQIEGKQIIQAKTMYASFIFDLKNVMLGTVEEREDYLRKRNLIVLTLESS